VLPAFTEKRDIEGADAAVADELIDCSDKQVAECIFRQCVRLSDADAIHFAVESHRSRPLAISLMRRAWLPHKPLDIAALRMLDDRLCSFVAIAIALIR
jgi:hypothetical protein